jgi:restriction system protein
VGRSRGFTSVLVQMQRQAERDARARAAAHRRAQVESDRARRAFERAVAVDQKERARLYTEARVAEVAALNESLAAGVSDLDGLLSSSLAVHGFLDFESLKETVPLPQFEPGALAVPVPPPDPSDFRPPEPGAAQKVVPGAKQRYLARFEAGRRQYDAAVQAHQLHETERLSQLEQGRAEHQRAVEAIDARLARQHAEVEAFRAAFTAGEPGAVVDYFALVLERSHYPEGFPQGFRLAYIPESRQLVIQYGLPGFGVVPAVAEYRYVRSGDKIAQKACPVRERQDRYKRVVAGVTVRTLHEVFEADRSEIAETIVFNGHVDTINEATGKQDTRAWSH